MGFRHKKAAEFAQTGRIVGRNSTQNLAGMGYFFNKNKNGNDNQKTAGDVDDKVIAIPTLLEREQMRQAREKMERRDMARAAGPIINMPPVTKYLLGAILFIHIVLHVLLNPDQQDFTIMNFGFVPEKFHDGIFSIPMMLSPLTHMFLHGSWVHVVMNILMLAAFGSGVERWLGSRKMATLFILSGLFGVAAHYILNTTSAFPMIGASGAISGLFAAAIVMLGRGQKEMGGRFGILPFALLWIGLSIGFGMMGGPDGSLIAWAAHVGGFLGGFAILKIMRV